MKALVNGRIITSNEVLEGQAVVFSEKIKAIIPRCKLDNYEDVTEIDAQSNYIAPGFIDLHIHGAGGKDTMDATQEALTTIGKTVVETGVTGYLPTTMTMSLQEIYEALSAVKEKKQEKNTGVQVLGAHMEGPFINQQYKGAQKENYIYSPQFEMVKDYLDVIKLITLAPERDEEFQFIKRMQDYEDIVLSIGHSDASYEQSLKAINQGVENITHLFNAMNSFHHRRPGILGAAFNTDVVCELIADTVHVHPDLFQLVVNIKGKDNLVLVTDCMKAGGMEPGEYELGGQKVFVDEDSARLEDGTLAGSILTLNQAVENMVVHTELSVSEVVNMVTLNPAQVLGLEENKGSIAMDKDADLVVLDEEFTVERTIIGGETIYQRKN